MIGDGILDRFITLRKYSFPSTRWHWECQRNDKCRLEALLRAVNRAQLLRVRCSHFHSFATNKFGQVRDSKSIESGLIGPSGCWQVRPNPLSLTLTHVFCEHRHINFVVFERKACDDDVTR